MAAILHILKRSSAEATRKNIGNMFNAALESSIETFWERYEGKKMLSSIKALAIK